MVIMLQGYKYEGFVLKGEVSVVIVFRGGLVFEFVFYKIILDCCIGCLLIQLVYLIGELEFYYLWLLDDIVEYESVLLLDMQMVSGGVVLMVVQVFVDYGVKLDRIVLVMYLVGKMGLYRLIMVFLEIIVVVCNILVDMER